MTIEIHQPEIEALINERLQSGAFHDVEDLLLHALRTSEPGPRTGQELIDACDKVRGLMTDDELDALLIRNPASGRAVDLE